jgi:hypothetical protein
MVLLDIDLLLGMRFRRRADDSDGLEQTQTEMILGRSEKGPRPRSAKSDAGQQPVLDNMNNPARESCSGLMGESNTSMWNAQQLSFDLMSGQEAVPGHKCTILPGEPTKCVCIIAQCSGDVNGALADFA